MTATTISVHPTFLVEPLTLLTKCVNQAFSDLESQCSRDVAIANAQVAEHKKRLDSILNEMKLLRRERDEALKAAEVCRQRVEQSNTSLQQVETRVLVHEETIAQLRRETVNWKDQSRNWQEHFLRVEQERCTMVSRIDELVEETRLANNNNGLRRNGAHVTPPPQHPDSAPSSTTTKGKSQSVHARPIAGRLESPAEAADSRRKIKVRPTSGETVTPSRPNRMERIDTSSTQQPKSKTGSHGPPFSASSSSSSDAPRESVLLRRVRATVETKVKDEEESDSEEAILQAEKDYYEAQRKLAAPSSVKHSPTKRKASRKSMQQDDDDTYGNSTSGHRRQPAKRTKVVHSDHDDDDYDEDEDGLEPLGGEVHDLPGSMRVDHRAPLARSRPALQPTSPPKRRTALHLRA